MTNFYLTGSVIQEGILDIPQLPQSKFYYWKNPATKSPHSVGDSPTYRGVTGGKSEAHDLIIFLSNAQPDLTKAEIYSRRIIQMAKGFKAQMVISFASMPQAIDHTQEPRVWFAASSQELKDNLKKLDFDILTEGQISGMNGLFLGIAKKEGLKGVCLLGEIPLYTIQIENPKASQVVLRAFSKMMNIQIDLSGLIEQGRTMENEINKLLDYLKVSPPGLSGPIGEDEIEKIKKTLSQLTKLPVSVKDRIEKLFLAAKTDITKANELKIELDKWNVYKEYEDKFLDLFKRTKDKGN